MAGSQPFMYDAVPRQTSKHPYSDFDPKAVSRASLTPKPRREKPDGPLVSFNQHPDSYLILPYGNRDVKPMNPSIKARVKNTRIIQLVLRCLELLGAVGLLVTMILISHISPLTGWLMRIPPGVAMLHLIYSIYHLGRRPGGRTPASSASYHFFASAFDASIIPFFAFAALVSSAQYKLAKGGKAEDGFTEWSSLLPAGQTLLPTLSGTAFLCATIAGGLNVISLVISLYLAITFRKITRMPPDMNPLEDNLTSRHKRNKSSMSTTTIASKRSSGALETYRNSGAPYEGLSRPPTVPFFNTRQGAGSTDTFSTYATPPGSRDSRLDLPSRQYHLQGLSKSNSPRTSVVELKRASLSNPPVNKPTYHHPASPPKPSRASYASLPMTEIPLENDNGQALKRVSMAEAWATAETVFPSNGKSPKKSKASYHPLFNTADAADENTHAGEGDDLSQTGYDTESKYSDDAVSAVSSVSAPSRHPNPLEANPPTPRYGNFPPRNNLASGNGNNVWGKSSPSKEARNSVLSEISLNPNKGGSWNGSGDLGDMSRERDQNPSQGRDRQPARSQPGSNINSRENGAEFKAKFYGELRAATPPVLVGAVPSSTTNGRQVSSGNDFSTKGFGFGKRRDVSGKVAEEGRGGGNGNGGWGARFRKVSGK